jgi:hypothetical protein
VADDPRVSGIHGRSVSADDQPSPVNQSALSVNPVGYDLGNFNGDGEDGSAPFIYDRGTQTIHLAPQGARHDQIKRWAGSKIQGPIYQGWQDGYTIDYHHAPQRHEREAIEQALQKHTGLPLEDVNLYDNDDQFNLYSKRRRKLANKCAVCGDLLKGVDCPRCNWGGWDHAEDNTKNPSDPTVDMSLGIQSKTAADGLLPCPDCGGDVQKTNRYHHDTTQVPYQCSRCHRTFGWNEVQNHGLLQPQGPACPKCTQEMHFREPSSLGPLYPEGAWQCSNFDCYHAFAPGQLTPDTYEDPDNASSGLTLPEHWGAPRPPEWQPGTEGKGILDSFGRVHTWQGDTPHEMYGGGRPWMDARSLFYIGPDGYVASHDGPVEPRHQQAIQQANPSLHFNWSPPDEFKLARTADYQGRTNWDTWNTELMIDNESRLLNYVHQMIESGKWTTPEQLRDWALRRVVGPYNQNRIKDAQEWNEIPKHDRLDHHWEDLKEKSPDAADLVDGLGFGPNVEDDEPELIDPELVNWLEVFQGYQREIGANQEYEREQQRLQGTGLSWTTPGHDDEVQQMRDAMYRYHGAVPEEELPPGPKINHPQAYNNIKVNVPLEHFKQWPGWPDNYLAGGPDGPDLFGHRFKRAEEKARAELMQKYPDRTPEQIEELLDSHGAFRPDYIRPHFPGGKYDTPFNLEDPEERAILEGHPTYQGWAQNGYPMSLSDFTWDTISAIRNGRPHPYTEQMQQALQQRGYTPEQIAQIMSQPQPYQPQPKQPDPSLDQPGDLTVPEDWGTFSRVIPEDRWRGPHGA